MMCFLFRGLYCGFCALGAVFCILGSVLWVLCSLFRVCVLCSGCRVPVAVLFSLCALGCVPSVGPLPG